MKQDALYLAWNVIRFDVDSNLFNTIFNETIVLQCRETLLFSQSKFGQHLVILA